MAKVNVLLPENGTFGAWLTDGADTDVHFYVNESFAVIGQNKSYKDKVEFSDMALAVHKDGKLSFQYANDDGELVSKEFSAAQAKKLILDLLTKAKNLVKD